MLLLTNSSSKQQLASSKLKSMRNIWNGYFGLTTTDTDPSHRLTKEADTKLFFSAEINNMITRKLNPKKAPGYYQISTRLLQELLRKGLVSLTYLFNAIPRLRYVQMQ